MTVKLTELRFTDIGRIPDITFGISAKVDRLIKSDCSLTFDLANLELNLIKAKLDGNGEVIKVIDEETGEEVPVLEQVPYPKKVNGILKLKVSLDLKNGIFMQEVEHNNSDVLIYAGCNAEIVTTNRRRELTPDLIHEGLNKNCNMRGW